MNHPKQEEWVPYLFGEAKAPERRRLKEHLRACPECRDEFAAWRRNLKQLDAWKLPPAERPRATFEPVLKWAFATVVVLVLGAGFAIGRLTSATVSAERVRAAIEPQLRQEIAQMLQSELDITSASTLAAAGQQTEALFEAYVEAFEEDQAEIGRNIQAALTQLESRQLADYVALKRDVDTLAVNTDAGLRLTEQQLVQLADNTPAASNPHSSAE